MPGNSELYRVVRSEQVRNQLRDWALLAKQAGISKQYVEALKFIEDRLRAEPLTWGDPLFHLPNLNLVLCRGLHSFLMVHYGVDAAKHLVFVKEYKLLPDNPLERNA